MKRRPQDRGEKTGIGRRPLRSKWRDRTTRQKLPLRPAYLCATRTRGAWTGADADMEYLRRLTALTDFLQACTRRGTVLPRPNDPQQQLPLFDALAAGE